MNGNISNIHKFHLLYYRIKAIRCPAFNNEFIYFNKYGFHHLLYKGRVPRTNSEINERFSLLNLSIKIIKRSTLFSNYRESHIGKSKAYFWAIRGSENGKMLRIIIRKKNNGKIHFFSLMKE